MFEYLAIIIGSSSDLLLPHFSANVRSSMNSLWVYQEKNISNITRVVTSFWNWAKKYIPFCSHFHSRNVFFGLYSFFSVTRLINFSIIIMILIDYWKKVAMHNVYTYIYIFKYINFVSTNYAIKMSQLLVSLLSDNKTNFMMVLYNIID